MTIKTDIINKKDLIMTYEELLQELKLLGVSNVQLAEFLGISRQAVNSWKKQGIPLKQEKKILEFIQTRKNNLSNVLVNSNIIHNSPHSTITATEAMSAFPPEVGAVIKFMLKHSEDERLKIMQCIMVKCGEEE